MRFKNKFSRLQSIFEKHQQSLYFAAMAITQNRAAAEDAVHDALLAVAEVSTDPHNLKAYLFQSLRNKALHSNKTQSRLYADTAETLEDQAPENFFDLAQSPPEQKVLATQVFKKMQTLDPGSQQVLILKLFAGMTFDEIATITDSSINTVASRYRRGLSKLRERIRGPQA